MSNEELVLETNSLLKQFLKLEEERKIQAEQAKGSLAEMREKMQSLRSNQESSDDRPLHVDLKEQMAKAQERAEAARLVEEQFKEELIAELKIQSDLLRQIKEKLG